MLSVQKTWYTEDEEQQEDDIFASEFVDDMRALARQYIDRFFEYKQMYSGGPVSRGERHDPGRVTMVLNTDIMNGVGRAYEVLEPFLSPEDVAKAEKFGYVTEDIKLVNNVLNEMSAQGIPKCFAGGILLMFLELCRGVANERPMVLIQAV